MRDKSGTADDVRPRGLGIDPKDLQGPRSVISFTTVTLVLALYALEALIIFASQRFIHRRPFADLGFRAPAVKHLLIGFGVGLAAWTAPLTIDLMTGDRTIEWSVPGTVPALTLIGYYCVFIFFLTANSVVEELVFRCYPIEQFRNRTSMLLVAIAASAVLFAGLHFIIGEFSFGRFLVWVAGACLMSYVYFYYRSIWLVIGLHNASNLVPFTFGGNWKMGGVFTLSGESTSFIAGVLGLFAPVFLMLLFYRFRPRKEA